MTMRSACTLLILVLTLAAALPAMASEMEGDRARAAWLLDRGARNELAPGDTRHFQDEIGGGSLSVDPVTVGDSGKGRNVGLKVLASAVLPGTGEALMGYKRGYFLMAADIFAWTQVMKNDQDGDDMLDAYYAYADVHYDDRRLVQAYTNSTVNPYAPELQDFWLERRAGTAGLGGQYFKDDEDNAIIINDIDELHNLPLYVTKEEDRREYYENLGKWDQFVFGWDDFTRPASTIGANPTYNLKDLSQPAVSRNRETYRSMRKESNDSYKARDRWLYVNIGLRLFSVVETAWLGGLLSGGEDEQMAVAGHPIQIVAMPQGRDRGTVGAKIWF